MRQYVVCECFENGKRFVLFKTEDRYTARVWLENHRYCTNALVIGNSWLEMEVWD